RPALVVGQLAGENQHLVHAPVLRGQDVPRADLTQGVKYGVLESVHREAVPLGPAVHGGQVDQGTTLAPARRDVHDGPVHLAGVLEEAGEQVDVVARPAALVLPAAGGSPGGEPLVLRDHGGVI